MTCLPDGRVNHAPHLSPRISFVLQCAWRPAGLCVLPNRYSEGCCDKMPGTIHLVRRDEVESAIEDSAAPIRDQNGTVTGAVILFNDVSESRTTTQKMPHLAQHDFLANLPNRMLSPHGGQPGIDAFQSAQQTPEPFDVVITDLGMPYVDGRQVVDSESGNILFANQQVGHLLGYARRELHGQVSSCLFQSGFYAEASSRQERPSSA